MRTQLLITAACLIMAGCGPQTGDPTVNDDMPANDAAMTNAGAMAGNGAAATGEVARATLATADGAPRGEATVSADGGGLRVVANVTGMEPGTYGFHLHQVGRCEGPEFTSAGSHWNPTERKHGLENPEGPHLGDLPNLTVGTDGRGTVEGTIAGGTMAGLLDADGASVMVHADPDDNRTDPSGNSGARIACGVLSAG